VQVGEDAIDIGSAAVKKTVIQMLTKPMKLAEYYCSGACMALSWRTCSQAP
jgi:hypothetical protein